MEEHRVRCTLGYKPTYEDKLPPANTLFVGNILNWEVGYAEVEVAVAEGTNASLLVVNDASVSSFGDNSRYSSGIWLLFIVS